MFVASFRLCYDHLAGQVGVELLSSLLKRRRLLARGRDFVLTKNGERLLHRSASR